MISIIVAISEDYGIGRNNDLLWQIPDDLKRFRRLTMGHCLIMGKRTWESLPRKPLQGRRNIVLTDKPGERFEGSETVYSAEEALALSRECSEVFVIGGGSVYRQFMPLADRLYITHVHGRKEADVFFPEIVAGSWKVTEKEDHAGIKGEIPPYSYVIYDRVRE